MPRWCGKSTYRGDRVPARSSLASDPDSIMSFPRHPIAVNEVTYMFPFAEITGQWEILRLIRGHTSPSAPGFLKTVCPKCEHEGLERDVGELLDCIEESANCGPSIKDRCAQLVKGRVSFIHLPDIFARGALISGNSNENGYQVAEIVSCEINSTSASGDVCEVLFSYFRWSGWALIKHNGRSEVQQYSGTRKLNDLPFSPIATYSNPGKTIEGYHASLGSSGKTLSFLKSLPSPEESLILDFFIRRTYLVSQCVVPIIFLPPFPNSTSTFDLRNAKELRALGKNVQSCHYG